MFHSTQYCILVISETMLFSYRSDDPTHSVKALSEGG